MSETAVRVTYVGHATMLLQMDGVRMNPLRAAEALRLLTPVAPRGEPA
jgi:hypothetical protein